MNKSDRDTAFIMRPENIAWYEDGRVRILDRRIYPIRIEYVTCTRHEEVAQAITDMVIQSGGPYIACAMGMALAAYEAVEKGEIDFMGYMEKAADTLSHARPTTVERMKRVAEQSLSVARSEIEKGSTGSVIIEALVQSAVDLIDSNYKRSLLFGNYLADKIPNGGTVMTQCYAESLICGFLTACRERNMDIKLICAETRPYFQGARLTASVGSDMGFDVTVISDNMPGYVMKKKKVDIFTSGADVITLDGHIVNKVGTFQIALAAHYWGIPYFVSGIPTPSHPDIDSVEIEERDPNLVLEALGTRLTLPSVKGYYPAFDITPPKLCDGVITDKGIFAPMNLSEYFKK